MDYAGWILAALGWGFGAWAYRKYRDERGIAEFWQECACPPLRAERRAKAEG